MARFGKVRLPVVHQPPPPLEQVRPCVGRFYLVLDHVSERRLDDLPRMVGLLGSPVPERGPEAWATAAIAWCWSICGIVDMDIGFPAPHGEHERTRPVAERPRGVEDLQRPPAQRNPVLTLRLHPRSGNRPHRRPRPSRPTSRAGLLPTGGRQHEKFDASLTAGCGEPDVRTVSMAAATSLWEAPAGASRCRFADRAPAGPGHTGCRCAGPWR